MPWQQSLKAAVRALKREEADLIKKLAVIRSKISELDGIGKRGGGAGTQRKAGPRRLSAKGRAAISRAAKKRWSEYRRQQRKG